NRAHHGRAASLARANLRPLVQSPPPSKGGMCYDRRRDQAPDTGIVGLTYEARARADSTTRRPCRRVSVLVLQQKALYRDVLPGMNAGASTHAVHSPLE